MRLTAEALRHGGEWSGGVFSNRRRSVRHRPEKTLGCVGEGPRDIGFSHDFLLVAISRSSALLLCASAPPRLFPTYNRTVFVQ